MQTGIHPNYYTDAVTVCSCGKKYSAGSTLKNIKVEVCSACHPFYTGKQDQLVDTTGRVDRFKAKIEKAKKLKAKKAEEKTEEKTKATVVPAKKEPKKKAKKTKAK